MVQDHVETLRVLVSGRVQGVGFRYWTRMSADRLGLSGWVRNLGDGRVEALLSGSPDAVRRMVDLLRRGPPHAHVTDVEVRSEPEERVREGFRITGPGW